MSTEENRELIRHFVEQVVNQHNPDALDQIIAPSFQTTFPGASPGREGFKQAMAAVFRGFPDIRTWIDDIVVDGDRVATRGGWEGTHQGEFQGIPPTGRRVKISYIDIWRVENGQFVENWVQMDFLGMLQQLGVVPSTSQDG
ncbi:MAG: ester cyclase [Chloroflexota bacterium]|nr:ester cyclase [Chloroflexota bacterium]